PSRVCRIDVADVGATGRVFTVARCAPTWRAATHSLGFPHFYRNGVAAECFPATYASTVIFLRSVVSVRRSLQRRCPYDRMGYDDLRDNQRRADRTAAGGRMLSEW